MRHVLAAAPNPVVILRQRRRARQRATPNEGSLHSFAEHIGLIWADADKKGGLAMQCDKNDYRGILAGLEGVSGKKAVDSETMTAGISVHHNGVYWCHNGDGQTIPSEICPRKARPPKRNLAFQDRPAGRNLG